MATLFINELKIPTVIGVYEWEKKILQTLSFDLEIAIDINKMANDDLANALDYVQICQTIENFLAQNSFNLIEVLAEQTAQLVFEKFALQSLRLLVKKPKVLPNLKDVAVLITKKV